MMSYNIPKFIMIDSGFWFALYNTGDTYHSNAIKLLQHIERTIIVIPWPSLYEVLNTRFISDPITIQKIEMILKRPNTRFIVDKPYRTKALTETIELSRIGKRKLSLVDSVIRKMLENPNLRVDGLITYNERDFVDICNRRKIPIINYLVEAE